MTRAVIFLTAALLSLAILAAPASAALPPCGQVSVRKDVRDLTPTEWTRFLAAVKTLQERATPTAMSAYDDLVSAHKTFTHLIHYTAQFLPWHRYYIREYERALQEIDPLVTLPYWNWAAESQAPELSTVWAPERFGGNGVAPDYFVGDGPFADWRPLLDVPHRLRRRWDEGDRISSFMPTALLEALIGSSETFTGFAPLLEGTPHGSVHNSIGGDMAQITVSPNDPIFFLHHAFIDKLWADWQALAPSHRVSYGGMNEDNWPATLDDTILGTGATVREVMDPARLCYRYREQGESIPTTTTVASSLSPATTDDRVTFVATVLGTSSGTVRFKANGTTLPDCRAVPLQMVSDRAQASCRAAPMRAGLYVIKAEYSGDDDHAATSGTLPGGHRVKVAARVTYDPDPTAVYGEPLGVDRLRATASRPGTTRFTVETPAADGSGSTSRPASPELVLPAGTYRLVARFVPSGGGANVRASAPLTVAPAPLHIRPDNVRIVYGQPVPDLTFVADGFVNGDDRSVLEESPVCRAGRPKGTPEDVVRPPGPYSIVCTGGIADNYVIDVRATGTLVVVRAATTTSLTASAPLVRTGRPVTLRAVVTPVAPGAGTPAGLVAFRDGSLVLGTAALKNRVATLTVANLPVGTRRISAHYRQSQTFQASTSPTATVVVAPASATSTVCIHAAPPEGRRAVLDCVMDKAPSSADATLAQGTKTVARGTSAARPDGMRLTLDTGATLSPGGYTLRLRHRRGTITVPLTLVGPVPQAAPAMAASAARMQPVSPATGARDPAYFCIAPAWSRAVESHVRSRGRGPVRALRLPAGELA
jgi:hypothetical protein